MWVELETLSESIRRAKKTWEEMGCRGCAHIATLTSAHYYQEFCQEFYPAIRGMGFEGTNSSLHSVCPPTQRKEVGQTIVWVELETLSESIRRAKKTWEEMGCRGCAHIATLTSAHYYQEFCQECFPSL